MTRTNKILFIQRSPTRAGAQTSLERMVLSNTIRKLNPAVLIARSGWLSEALDKHDVPTIVHQWPSPRSLNARLGGLKRASRHIANTLREAGINPTVIIANDHQECLLAHALSRALRGIPCIAILRTPGMGRRDFEKYSCGDCDAIFGVGHELRERIEAWASSTIPIYEEGFAENEFLPPKNLPDQFPKRIFVAGSEEPRKGFQDFFEAIYLLEKKHPNFPGLECHLTGNKPENEAMQGYSKKPFRSQFNFLGRVNDFIETASAFDLAIHPSRAESFGMAPLELILAGIPTLVSSTGVVEKLDIPETWKFPPSNVQALADCLENLWQTWPELSPEIHSIQKQIRQSYHIEHTTSQIAAEMQRLESQTKKS